MITDHALLLLMALHGDDWKFIQQYKNEMHSYWINWHDKNLACINSVIRYAKIIFKTHKLHDKETKCIQKSLKYWHNIFRCSLLSPSDSFDSMNHFRLFLRGILMLTLHFNFHHINIKLIEFTALKVNTFGGAMITFEGH